MIPQEKKGRKLVWHDEFDGNCLDTSKWFFRRSMHNPDVYYDNCEKNIRVEDGNLHLQVHRTDIDDKLYTLSEGCTTLTKMNFKYGYIEMSGRLPMRKGAWPSFWMLSRTHFMTAPYTAEIDIFEAFSSADTIGSALHKWQRTDGGVVHEQFVDKKEYISHYKFENAENLNNEYHTYALEWDKDYLRFYVDDNCYMEYPIDERGEFGRYNLGMDGFHDFFYVLFNNEIFTKNSWHPENCDLNDDDEMPIDYYIDYIRLYQKDGEELLLEEDIKTLPHTNEWIL